VVSFASLHNDKQACVTTHGVPETGETAETSKDADYFEYK